MNQQEIVPNSELPPDAGQGTPLSHFYRVVWRWHFYAGLLVVPLVLMLAITGLIYLYEPQIDQAVHGHLLRVQPGTERLTFTQQVEAVQQAYPGAAINNVTPHRDAAASTWVSLSTAEVASLTAYIDPYTGQVLGSRDEDRTLPNMAINLHGSLMMGTFGDYLIEIAASWGIVLVVSGVYLWWPRKQPLKLAGVLWPRLGKANGRSFWRDIHAVTGFWAAALLLFMLVTGLPWASFWGDQFAKIWVRYPAQLWDDVPQSEVLMASLNTTANKIVPWAMEQTPLPVSTQPGRTPRHAGHDHDEPTGPALDAEGRVTLDSVIALAYAEEVAEGFTVSLPADEAGVYTVSVFPDDARRQTTLHIDQYSGEILADIRYADYALVPRLVEMGIVIHEGRFFGLANQLLMTFACLAMITLAVSGTVMWWRRRPAGRLGVPPMPSNFPVWYAALAVLIALALMFPMVGITLAAALLLDFAVIQRLPALKQALS